jgi:pre-mRNA-splicing helicase BRR2
MGFLRVVFSTDTLAYGINMPCRSVIFAGDSVFLNSVQFQQMAGRAGRPQYDTEGVCVILTSDDRSDHFRGAMTAKIPIESKMKAKLVEHLNAEIVLETITDIAQAVDWVCSTFYFTRACSSPRCTNPCVLELLCFT